MTDTPIRRRTFLAGTATAALAAGAPAARAAGDDAFGYEVTRTDAEWREMLSELDYSILRAGATEPQHASPLSIGAEAGRYACKGCGLDLYDGRWKVDKDIGYAFFRHAVPDSMLTGIDEVAPNPEGDPDIDRLAQIEVHCRRCGSHIGHIFVVQGEQLHCSNGSALVHTPAKA